MDPKSACTQAISSATASSRPIGGSSAPSCDSTPSITAISSATSAASWIIQPPRISDGLYRQPGISATVNFDHIKRHYYVTHDEINPTHIVPLGPALELHGVARPRENLLKRFRKCCSHRPVAGPLGRSFSTGDGPQGRGYSPTRRALAATSRLRSRPAKGAFSIHSGFMVDPGDGESHQPFA